MHPRKLVLPPFEMDGCRSGEPSLGTTSLLLLNAHAQQPRRASRAVARMVGWRPVERAHGRAGAGIGGVAIWRAFSNSSASLVTSGARRLRPTASAAATPAEGSSPS